MLRPLFAAAALLAVPALALAQPGPFDGRWRVMLAARLPDLAPLPSAPLLRHGVIVASDRVQGPAEITCPQARATSDVVAPSDVFPGLDRAVAARLHDQSGMPARVSTLRIVCDGRTVVWHLNAYSEALMVVGDVLYTVRPLQNPPLLRNDDLFLQRLDPAFDCTARPWTANRRVICEWPQALEADHLARTFTAELRGQLSPAQQRVLDTSQAEFDRFLPRACPHAVEELDDVVDRNPDCEALYLNLRAMVMFDTRVHRVGGVAVEPRFNLVQRADGRTNGRISVLYDARPQLVGASPAVSRGFDAEFRRRVPADLGAGADRSARQLLRRTYAVVSMTERFVSLKVTDTEGGPNSTDTRDMSVNVDLRTGRGVGPDEVFRRTDAWRRAVIEALTPKIERADLFARVRDRVLAGDRGVVWLFGPDTVTVAWGWGSPMVETVDIPAATLAPFLKPDSPWQPGTGRVE